VVVDTYKDARQAGLRANPEAAQRRKADRASVRRPAGANPRAVRWLVDLAHGHLQAGGQPPGGAVVDARKDARQAGLAYTVRDGGGRRAQGRPALAQEPGTVLTWQGARDHHDGVVPARRRRARRTRSLKEPEPP